MHKRLFPATWASVGAALIMAACASPPPHDEHPTAASIAVRDQWASAGDSGMTAVFGTFTNNGHHDAHLVSATSPAAARVEVHEVVPGAGGTMTMRPKAGGVTIAAGASHELRPGGDHLMLMDLRAPLRPGDDVELTVAFDDGSQLPFTAQVREFAGANEDYQPAPGTGATTPPHHGG